jgi:Mrp family chromosome partitioning ATPase
MDRIRKALDRARDERELQEPAAPRAAPESDGRSAKPAVPAAITYTRTQVFDPDPTALERSRVIAQNDNSGPGAAFRLLRTQVLQRMAEHGFLSIAVVSPRAAEGKTLTAVNLAAQIAADRRHTALLVDYDLQRPGIATAFGLLPEVGVADVLSSSAEVDHCLYHPRGFDRLVLLPAVARAGRSSELTAGPRSRALIAELRGRYRDRINVFDLPPLLTSDETVALAPCMDCVLLVVAEGSTARADVLRSLELLRKATVVGTVLNRASESLAGRN